MKPPVLAAAPLLAAVVWSLAVAFGRGPWEPHSTLLVGLGLLAPASVAVIGMVVVGARWALRLGWAVMGGTALLAMLMEISRWWVVGVAVSLISALALIGVSRHIRKLPGAAGPPGRAVLLPLVLLAVPFVVGAAGVSPGWAALASGISAPVCALLYGRVVPGGLLAVRVGWPLLAIGTAPFITWPWWTIVVALGGAALYLAWHPSVKVAFHPPREVGSTFPIPPELTPKEILDAARLDDRGRRK